jgi:hypothetical protein
MVLERSIVLLPEAFCGMRDTRQRDTSHLLPAGNFSYPS